MYTLLSVQGCFNFHDYYSGIATQQRILQHSVCMVVFLIWLVNATLSFLHHLCLLSRILFKELTNECKFHLSLSLYSLYSLEIVLQYKADPFSTWRILPRES